MLYILKSIMDRLNHERKTNDLVWSHANEVLDFKWSGNPKTGLSFSYTKWPTDEICAQPHLEQGELANGNAPENASQR